MSIYKTKELISLEKRKDYLEIFKNPVSPLNFSLSSDELSFKVNLSDPCQIHAKLVEVIEAQEGSKKLTAKINNLDKKKLSFDYKIDEHSLTKLKAAFSSNSLSLCSKYNDNIQKISFKVSQSPWYSLKASRSFGDNGLGFKLRSNPLRLSVLSLRTLFWYQGPLFNATVFYNFTKNYQCLGNFKFYLSTQKDQLTLAAKITKKNSDYKGYFGLQYNFGANYVKTTLTSSSDFSASAYLKLRENIFIKCTYAKTPSLCFNIIY